MTNTAIDYFRLVREILVTIRQEMSQIEFSQILGFKYNKVHKWENELKILRFDEFLAIAEARNLDLSKSFETLMIPGNLKTFGDLYYALCKDNDEETVAYHLKISSSTLNRWIKGKTSPPFSAVLKLIDFQTPLFLDFVASLVAPYQIEYLQNRIEYQQSLTHLISKYPFAPGIEAHLGTDSYSSSEKPSIEYLADHLNVPSDKIARALIELENAGLIVEVESDKYIKEKTSPHIAEISQKDFAQFEKFWTEHLLSKINEFGSAEQKMTNSKNLLALTRVVPLSDATTRQIRLLLTQTHLQIIQLIKKDEQNETAKKARSISTHVFDI